MYFSSKLWATLRQDLVFIWILATGATFAGLSLNQIRDRPIPLVYQTKVERLDHAVVRFSANNSPPSVALNAPEADLSLEEFRNLVGGKRGIILDARPEIFYRLGHVPGAVSLPRDDFESACARLSGTLLKDKLAHLVIYCSGSSCEDSHLVQAALVKLGFSNVTIFAGGWEDWKNAGLAEEKR